MNYLPIVAKGNMELRRYRNKFTLSMHSSDKSFPVIYSEFYDAISRYSFHIYRRKQHLVIDFEPALTRHKTTKIPLFIGKALVFFENNLDLSKVRVDDYPNFDMSYVSSNVLYQLYFYIKIVSIYVEPQEIANEIKVDAVAKLLKENK